MDHLVGDFTGLVHVIASTLALLFGTVILFLKKGTKRHTQVGYLYVGSMVILLITAFMIYRLFGKWGIFHYTSILSLLTLVAGMWPILNRKRFKNWKYLHMTFMYWSVFGLYCAFAAELLTRIPDAPFYSMIGWATGGVMGIGGILFGINKKRWMNA